MACGTKVAGVLRLVYSTPCPWCNSTVRNVKIICCFVLWGLFLLSHINLIKSKNRVELQGHIRSQQKSFEEFSVSSSSTYRLFGKTCFLRLANKKWWLWHWFGSSWKLLSQIISNHLSIVNSQMKAQNVQKKGRNTFEKMTRHLIQLNLNSLLFQLSTFASAKTSSDSLWVAARNELEVNKTVRKILWPPPDNPLTSQSWNVAL